MNQEHNGFPSIIGYDAWIENGRTKEACFELMISVDCPTRSAYENGFWLEFTAPTGEFMGWMRFIHLSNIKNQAIFAAAEWRRANDQAPAQQDVLLPSLAPQKAGNGYGQ
jgi:hypothetical protein